MSIKLIHRVMAGILLWLPAHYSLANGIMSVVGEWTTISDKTHEPRAVVRIVDKAGVLEGYILRVYKKAGDQGYCLKCPEPLKNKPIVGLRFLWGLKQSGSNEWAGGKILDPKAGRIYNCKLTLSDDGKTLSVRGYIGVSLFGRTQTWFKKQPA